MSGIYGVVQYDGSPVTPETLAPMAGALAFYGPDGHGQWCGEAAGLGHLMLHVTPESLRERLPASIRVAPHLIITADARIDNRDELFDALGVPGQGRNQTPDSSLILLAFERWGPDCVKRLLGDFAFAIWDGRERRLFCARDPFGCKPFVYHHAGTRFVFASEVSGVLAEMESPRLNEPLLATFLQMKTYHAQKKLTFFNDVVKLPPAHTLTVTTQGIRVSRYWSPHEVNEARPAKDRDYAAELRGLFHQAVECRLRSAFPIGSHLSGGLDSSAVTVVAAQGLRRQGRSLGVFSYSPPPVAGAHRTAEDEHTRIEAICEQESLSCQYTVQSLENHFLYLGRDMTVDPRAYILREELVHQLAQNQGYRVILSGCGGDEAASIATPNYLNDLLLTGQWSTYLRGIRMLNDNDGKRGVSRFRQAASKLISPWLPDSIFSHLNAGAGIYHPNRSCCIAPAFAHRHREAVRELRGPSFRQQPGIRATMCHFLEFGHIPYRMEQWNGSGARRNLVYRYPLLDRRLVEFALGTPPREFLGPGVRRAMFRRAVQVDLPKNCNWMASHREPAGRAMIQEFHRKAFAQWAERLDSVPAPTQFIDPAKIRDGLRVERPNFVLADLSGIREAFACYLIPKRYF